MKGTNRGNGIFDFAILSCLFVYGHVVVAIYICRNTQLYAVILYAL